MNCRMLLSLLRTLSVALVALLLVALPGRADAFVKEGQAWAGAGIANIGYAAPTATGWWGPAVDAGVVVHLSDFWRLGADIGASQHFKRDDDDENVLGPHTVLTAALGVRYTLDVFTYVPWVELGLAYHPLGPPSSAAPQGDPLSARARLGVDYRYNRELSFGLNIAVHAPLTQPADFPHYSSIGLHVGYHFRRF